MRLIRIVLLFGAGLLALLLLGAVLALQSGVQTWAARRYVAAHPSWRTSVGSVSAGLDSVRLRDLRIERHGVVFTLPELEAELPPWALLLGRPVPIRRLVAKGWTLDLTRWSGRWGRAPAVPAATASASLIASARAEPAAAAPLPPAESETVFRGLFDRLNLPADLRLENLDGEGDILLAPPVGPATVALRVHVRVSGGGLAPGQTGRFAYDLAQSLPSGTALLNSVTAQGTIEATLGAPGTFTRLNLRIQAAAHGGRLPGEVRLAGDLGAVRGPAGEGYTATLRRDDKELASVSADFVAASPRLAGAWKFNLADSDVSPFALGRLLPVFALVGDGRFDTDETLALAHVSGELNATFDHLGVVWPQLSEVGTASLKADFDLTHRHGLFRVDHLRAVVTGEEPVLTVQALQAFAFNAASGELQVADATRDLLSIDLEGIPVEWIWPFLPNLRLTGDPIRGHLVASARGGGLALHSTVPLGIAGLSAARGGRLLVQDLDVSLGLAADCTPQGWQANVDGHASDVAGGSGRGLTPALAPLFSVSAKIGRLVGAAEPIKITGQFSGYLPAWAAQPGFPAVPALMLASPQSPGGLARVTGGALTGDFSASVAAESSLEAKVLLTDLALASDLGVERWPRVTAEVRASSDRAGRIAFTAPWTFERADHGKSDLTLEGTLAPTRRGLAFDGRAASNRLVLDDAKILGVLWVLPKIVAAESPDGRLALALKEVENGRWTATGVKGQLYAVPGALEIDDVAGAFAGGGDFKINGAFSHAGPATPYALQAEVVVNHFEAAPVFRAIDPERPPILEGRCSVTARVAGRGASPHEMLSRISGDFALSSQEGVIRALRAEVVDDIKQAPSRLSKAVDSVTSLFGKSEAAQSYIDKQGRVVVKITEAFKEIRYDQLRIRAQRDEGLSLHLAEFSLISPEIRLAGNGQITHQDGVVIGAQPLDLTINVRARGQLAELMNEVGLLNGREDDLGYTGLTSAVVLGGSLDDIDETQWKELLIKAAMRKAAGSLLDKLLGK